MSRVCFSSVTLVLVGLCACGGSVQATDGGPETGGAMGTGGAAGSASGGTAGIAAGGTAGIASGGAAGTATGGAGATVDPGTPAPAPPGCAAQQGSGPNATTTAALTTPNPTLRNLSIEWAITGDANNNGVVSVRFRRMGGQWRQGMSLRRTPAGSNVGFSWANRHSGSIFDLEPDTAYEVEVALRDADGGCDTRTLMVRTRAVPVPMAGAPVKATTPSSFSAVMVAAAPGDILELAAGAYPGFSFNRDGEAGKPIVIRGAAGAVVNGNIDLLNRKFVHLTGLTVNGRIRFNGSRAMALTRNTVNTTSDGIVTYQRAEDCYIADNVIKGATKWEVAALGVNGDNIGEGILVTGPGHVIEHNRVSGFRDNISTLEQGEAVDQWSIDIVENDIDTGADDGVEADFCFHNCRIMRNRLTNVFIAISAQPSLD